MVNKILKLCRDKGFLLDKEMLELLSGLEKDKASKILEILFELKIQEKIITRKLFDKYIEKYKDLLISEKDGKMIDKNADYLIYPELQNTKIKLLSDMVVSSKKISVADFIRHFRARYEAIKNILKTRDFENLSSIRRIGINSGVWTVIVMVLKKRITKNKNLLIEVEDLTGSSVVLVNKENNNLFERAKELLLHDVVAIRVSGSSKMLFANDIICPDAVLNEEKYGDIDEYVAFSGDFHIGSKMFLKKNLLSFVAWLNGEIGDNRQKTIAKKVKYLFLIGDNIDGVGIYSEQDKFLDIKSCREQYRKLGEILRKIRGDIQIVMCPGQHDAVWVGEPQFAISKKWAPDLYQIENLHLVPNPALVEICGGFKILVYHGASINRFIDELSGIRIKYGHKSPTKIVKEMLKRRHLAPVHGLMDYVPCGENDPMVINMVPDIIATADQHRAEINSYNNILMIASSCWQSRTPFEEKVGNVPEPCKVPLFNLKTREVKIIDFSENDEIKWQKDEDLVCKLNKKRILNENSD